jgi:hypothetical protein
MELSEVLIETLLEKEKLREREEGRKRRMEGSGRR